MKNVLKKIQLVLVLVGLVALLQDVFAQHYTDYSNPTPMCNDFADIDGDFIPNNVDRRDDRDFDEDGVGNHYDYCAYNYEIQTFSQIGTPCDDGDVCTKDDIFTSHCTCEGTLIGDENHDGVLDYCDSLTVRPMPYVGHLSCEASNQSELLSIINKPDYSFLMKGLQHKECLEIDKICNIYVEDKLYSISEYGQYPCKIDSILIGIDIRHKANERLSAGVFYTIGLSESG